MYKTFGETIASLRRAHGMRQQTLADALAEAGVPVSNQAVSKWENDATLPNAQQFLTLCRALDVDDIAGTFSGGDAGGLLAGLNARFRNRTEETDTTVLQEIYYEADRKECRVSWRPVRPLPDEEIWFENVWKDYREDGIIR